MKRLYDAATDTAWERFAATGKIEAYLDYKKTEPSLLSQKEDTPFYEAENRSSGPAGL